MENTQDQTESLTRIKGNCNECPLYANCPRMRGASGCFNPKPKEILPAEYIASLPAGGFSPVSHDPVTP